MGAFKPGSMPAREQIRCSMQMLPYCLQSPKRELSRQAEITQVIFNNNYEDQGQRNGREMIKLLAART